MSSDLLGLASLLADAAEMGHARSFDRIAVVLNPKAGALRGRVRRTGVLRGVERLLRAQDAQQPSAAAGRHGALPREIRITAEAGDGARHGAELSAVASRRGERLLLISAGGDGAHCELSSGALSTGLLTPGWGAVHRLPLGTGNDGGDAESLQESIGALSGNGVIRSTPLLRIEQAGAEPQYAFNIASFGLDAYVSHLTNVLKGRVPGDSYRIIADAATLVYEAVLGVPDQELLVYDGDGSSRTYRGQYMLCAIGVSGFRTYGHRKPILPQAANVCVIRRVGLRDKLRLKAAVFAGTHLSSPHVLSESAQVLEFSAAGPLPMQADGEARWIAPDRFPVRLTLVPDAVPALRSRH